MTDKRIYTVGGTVQAGSGLYIRRQADHQLLEACLRQEYAYLLASRQIGKSSLMVSTAQALEKTGIQAAIVDVSTFEKERDQWYISFLFNLQRSLRLDIEPADWWYENENYGHSQRFTRFMEEIILTQVEDSIVVFIDEIDSLLNTPFCDDFIVSIRALYNYRASKPDFKRLSFVLIGVATPTELVREIERTPFNIGYRVELADFTFDEAAPLASGLGLLEDNARETLDWILSWTGGHPYLTQRLCVEISKRGLDQCYQADVDRIVKEAFFSDMRQQDVHLLFVRDMLLKRSRDQDEVIRVYRAVRLSRFPVLDDSQSTPIAHLKLSGIVHVVNNQLITRNAIYEKVFDRRWINRHTTYSFWHDLPPAVRASLIVIVLLLVGLLGSTALAITQLSNTQREALARATAEAEARTRAETAEAAKATAEAAQVTAEEARIFAEEQALLNLIQKLNSQALTPSNRSDLELLLDIEAHHLADTIDTRTALGNALNRFPYQIRMLHGHKDFIESVTISPDGKQLATASFDGTVRLWDADTGESLGQPLSSTGDKFLAVTFSPDGSMLAATGADGHVVIWDTANLELIDEPWPGHAYWAYGLAFGPDNTSLVSTAADGQVIFWDITASGVISDAVAAHDDEIVTVAVSPDGRQAATGSRDRKILLWDVASRTPLPSSLEGHSGWINDLAYSPDGSLLASGSYDGTVILWDVATQEQWGDPIVANSTGNVTSVAFSPDGTIIATGGNNRQIRLWDVATGIEIMPPLEGHTQEIRDLVFSPSGDRLYSVGNDYIAIAWDLNGNQGISRQLRGHEDRINAFAISNDGSMAISAGLDNSIRFWGLNDGAALGPPLIAPDQVEVIALSPDERLLASGGLDQQVTIWDLASRETIISLDGHDKFIETLAFSPQGDVLASGGADGRIIFWDTDSWEPIGLPLDEHQDGVESISFSSDGRLFASGSYDGRVILWDLSASTITTKTLQTTPNWVHSVAFSPDGQMLASAHANKTIQLWNVSEGTPIGKPLEGHTEEVNSVAFSPDGRTLASVGRDGYLILWDIETRTPFLGPLEKHEGWIWTLAFTPDGKHLLTAGDDRQILVWNLNPSDWEDIACKKANRNFSAEEWEQFFGELVAYRLTCNQ